MTTLNSVCPRCQVANHVGEELIGRYTRCQNCGCLFYVEVPTLEESSRGLTSAIPDNAPPPVRETTLDDLLWDTQQGSRFIIKSLARQERRLQQVLYGMIALAVLLIGNLVLTALR